MRFLPHLGFVIVIFSSVYSETLNGKKWPTVGISVLIRNKAHCLPYFLSSLKNLDYPKDRLYIWFYSDHNEDKSDDIVDYWVTLNEHLYHHIYVKHNESAGPLHPDESSPTQWSNLRFRHVIKLREDALKVARQKWADFLFMLDADVYLTNSSTLKTLVSLDYSVVAPMLQTEGMYSNFWAAMTERKFYKRSRDYRLIREREKTGCFDVPMIHSAVLINLNHPKTTRLTYDSSHLIDYDGPVDDIIIFAVCAQILDVPLKICNSEHSGYVQVPIESGENIKKDIEQLINIKMLALAEENELPLNEDLSPFVFYPEPTKLGLNEIYMINLDRREKRREYMEKCFKELGLSVKRFAAIDGLSLRLDDLPYNIKLMPGYEDPYHHRPMKLGEIGCFLSHYQIWEEVVQQGYDKVMILEDDVLFRPYFRLNVRRLLKDISEVEWDLVYIGRKILMPDDERQATSVTVNPHYSYWTIGYLLSNSGARKLLAAEPLDKMLPVDEFLPIMFDKHPNNTWKNFFPERNLRALSSHPLLVEPVRYVNQPGYISDTERSQLAVDFPSGRVISITSSTSAGYEFLESYVNVNEQVPGMSHRIEL